jgi:hypothetical protein
MKISWVSKKTKADVVLNKLKAISSVLPDGRVSFGGFEKFQLDSILFSMIDFHKEYSHATARSFYSSALNAWVIMGGESADEFIVELNKLVVSHSKKPLRKYGAVTSISLTNGFCRSIIKLPNSTVQSFPKGLPKKYAGREAYHKDWRENGSPLPAHYCPVIVRFEARSPTDGMDFALDELDYVRGLHVLSLNSAYSATIGGGSGSRLPINSVMLGGMHTLHMPTGAGAVGDTYWYESDYTEIKSANPTDEKKAHVRNFFDQMHEGILAHKDGYVLRDAVIRYARAFDGSDKNYVLQKTWAALESILAANENNTDLVVRRCSFLYLDRDYHRQVLEHIKSYRNRSVHTGRVFDNPNDQCYQVQHYFRQALIFHVSNAKVFRDLKEANEFLDLPDLIPDLERKIFLLNKAVNFRSPK